MSQDNFLPETADHDILDKSNLLNNSDTVEDLTIKTAQEETRTEVTSIAQEEAKTGQKIPIPNAEELVSRASVSLFRNLQDLNTLITSRTGGDYKISRKGMNRVLNSVLNLPTEDIPVKLQTKEEKLAFALGQRIIADRMVIIQHYINEEVKKAREQKANNTNDSGQAPVENKGVTNE